MVRLRSGLPLTLLVIFLLTGFCVLSVLITLRFRRLDDRLLAMSSLGSDANARLEDRINLLHDRLEAMAAPSVEQEETATDRGQKELSDRMRLLENNLTELTQRLDQRTGLLELAGEELLTRLAMLEHSLAALTERYEAEREASSPELARSYAELAAGHFNRESFEDAARYYLMAWELDPSPPAYPYGYASALWEAEVVGRDYPEIRRSLDTVLAKDPHHPEGRRFSYRFALERGDAQRAADDGLFLTALHPEDLALSYQVGRLCLSQGMFDQATGLLEHVVAGRPGDFMAALYLGDALRESGQASRARESYAAALERRENFVPALSRLGELSFDQGEYHRAAFWWEKAAGRQPSAILFHKLGGAWLGAERYQEAMDAWEWSNKAVELFTLENRRLIAANYGHLARTARLLGNLDDALSHCEAGIAQYETPELLMLGMLLREQLGRDSGDYRERLVQGFPDSPEAASARAPRDG